MQSCGNPTNHPRFRDGLVARMHTALTRANALAAYTMSVLASLTFLCFLSTFFNEYQVRVEMVMSMF